MSLHYLLDGYNIIHQIPELSLEKLEVQRNELVRLIERSAPQGSLNNSVTIVFDGKSAVFGSSSSSRVKVLFSRDESADEKIKRIVAQAPHPKNIIVVTNDRDIQYAVKGMGARAMAVYEFLSKAKSSSTRRGSQGSQPKGRENKHISKVLEFKITSELERIWLKPKE